MAGAAGRLGEALLAATLSSPRYRAVTVLTEGPLGSTVGGLDGRSLGDLQRPSVRDPEAPELDVFVCWGDADDPMGRAHNRRDAIYAEVSDPEALRAVAHAACGLGARRLLLLAPLLAWQQVSAASRMLPEAMEMELARLAIPTIVILRPTTERQRVLPAGATRLQRFARFYLSQLRFMLPAVTHSLRSTDIARAAVSIMADADAPGLSVIPLDEIRLRAGAPAGKGGDKPGDNAGKHVEKSKNLGDNRGDNTGDNSSEAVKNPVEKPANNPANNPAYNPGDSVEDNVRRDPVNGGGSAPAKGTGNVAGSSARA